MSVAMGVQGFHRRFHCIRGNARKFWEVFVADEKYIVHYGRIGTEGQAKTTMFRNHREASQHADDMIRQKLAKGYEEVSEQALNGAMEGFVNAMNDFGVSMEGAARDSASAFDSVGRAFNNGLMSVNEVRRAEGLPEAQAEVPAQHLRGGTRSFEEIYDDAKRKSKKKSKREEEPSILTEPKRKIEF